MTKGETEVWYANGIFVGIAHLIALYAFVYVTPKVQTLWLAYVCWQLATLGITMGYHRLWSHKAFKATDAVKYTLAVIGTMGFQGSIKWWVLRHRLHHRFTDTEHDPYNAKKGLWFSHMGWIFEKPFYPRMKFIDQEDLNADPVVVFQHKNFVPLAFASGVLAPTILGLFWGDAWGSFFYCGFVARIAIWHVTFCINSLAHYIGDQVYSTELTARGNLLLALITNGEGYHNFHHEFPKDYRNGIEAFDWDPTKWVIKGLSHLGLTYDLAEASENEILKAKITTAEEHVAEYRKKVDWGPISETLSTYTSTQFHENVTQGKRWLIINGEIFDVAEFIPKHPGGEKFIQNYIGKDATKGFFGNANNHTKSARTLLAMLRVGKVTDNGVSSPESKQD